MPISIPVVASGGAKSTVTLTDPVVASSGTLNLPRVPWEGGPAYWAQFPAAARAGWTDPSFFPISIDPCSWEGEEDLAWDRAHGVNVYNDSANPWANWHLLEGSGAFYLSGPELLNYNRGGATADDIMPADFVAMPGYRVADEVDGTATNPEEGYATLTERAAKCRGRNGGQFLHVNYTQMVNLKRYAAGETYINGPWQDVVSMDMYCYTIPERVLGDTYVESVGGLRRSAASYGAMVRGLRERDALDGARRPVWFYVENVTGSPGEEFVRYIQPNELKGAVWSCLINEARGICWFNCCVSGAPGFDKPTDNLRRAQRQGTTFFGYPQIVAMGEVNNQIHRLAPVLNTQSYVWSFGTGLETMLKAKDGSAYVFAQCANGTTPGSRTFTLPAGVNGTTVEVVDENRSLTVSGGKFTDTFAAEYSYHVYRIAL